MLSPAQCRAARALLGITQRQLATAAGVSELTLRRYEAEKTDPLVSTRDRVERALAAAGITLVDDDRGVGVILRTK
jgi:transcriptional regulator with XRE-family HTH domain